jgi:hypothetical protein
MDGSDERVKEVEENKELVNGSDKKLEEMEGKRNRFIKAMKG